jgi:menaquinone-9 beta-reductase
MTNSFDAVIIGAGPAGSSAAILLARAGWSVAIVEKQRFPRRKVCGECIAASNLALLESLGIGAAFEANAGPELHKVALMRGASQIVADLPDAKHQKYRWGRALGRETLDTLLLEQARATGATILQPWSVQKIVGSAGDWRIEIRDEDSLATQKLQATITIAANGSWEALPSDRPKRRLARNASDLLAFKANFREVNLEEGLLALLSFNGGYGGMVVADGALTTLACCIRRDKLEALRIGSHGMRVGDIVETMLKRECIGIKNALQNAVREGNWLAAGPIDPGIKLKSDEGLFRIGNAAGEAHPIIGEGMSMALQSAWLLCAHLVVAKNSSMRRDVTWQSGVSSRYAAEWRQHFAPRLRLAASFAHIAMRPAPAISLLALLRLWPSMLTLGANLGGKVCCAVSPDTISLLAPIDRQLKVAKPLENLINTRKPAHNNTTVKELI